MIIVENRTTIEKGQGHLLVERFNKTGEIEKMPGFLGMEVMVRQRLKDNDEIVISTRWEDDNAFKAWMNSESFKKAHSGDRAKPEYILGNEIVYYSIPVIRQPINV